MSRHCGNPVFELPAGDSSWPARRFEALARSLLDGLSVWLRELLWPVNERSPEVILHETERARRLADLWEEEIDHPQMRGRLDMAQITLACGLGLELRNPDFRRRPGHPKMCA